eukprot:CAMPEP_0177735348 /NCGR_PEP_ID=MMETSP0484_2-20121128/24723_1 /TAXON_ID=354590 /ORGANISM="Rhodomonas lens, Strain RHODO" /LENGTH=44 /DNA_ID= /DNA_START= /DNA_END= /DNA_ORIENTATION=
MAQPRGSEQASGCADAALGEFKSRVWSVEGHKGGVVSEGRIKSV